MKLLQKEKQILAIKDQTRTVNIIKKLKQKRCKDIKAQTEEIYYKGKFCAAAPKSFWCRKKNTISQPLKPYFKGSTGHSNAIPMNKEMQLLCKKEIEELGYLSYS